MFTRKLSLSKSFVSRPGDLCGRVAVLSRRRGLASGLVAGLMAGCLAVPFALGDGAAAPEPSTVSGGVQDAGGDPLAGARVVAVGDPKGAAWLAPVETRTSEAGRFSLTPPGEPPFAVRVMATGHADAELVGVEPETPQEITLLPARSVHGRVHEQRTGEPVAGARVRLAVPPLAGHVSPEVAPELLAVATTDEDGRFRLGRLAAGVHDIRIEAEGYAAKEVALETVSAGEEGQARADEPRHIYLGPGLSIEGRIVGPSEEPVVGARVRVRPDRLMSTVEDLSGWRQGAVLSTRTLDDGRFHLSGVPRAEAFTLLARREGLADGRWVELRPGPGGHIRGLELRMGEGADIRARLVDAEGDPVDTRVTVAVRYRDTDPDSNRLPHIVRRSSDTAADAPGTLVVHHVPAGRASVTLAPEAFAETTIEGVALRSGDSHDLGEILVEQGASIEGRVLDSGGEPLAGVGIRARAFTGFGTDQASVRTRDDGRFRFGGLEEKVAYDLYVEEEGFAARDVQEVEPGSEPLEIRLDPAASLRGRVLTLGTGQPVPRYEIEVLPADLAGGGLDRRRLMRQLLLEREEISSADGRFAVTGLAGGAYRLRIRAEGHVTQVVDDVELSTGEETDIGEVRLDPGVSIEGRVIDAETGQPVVGATVRLAASGPLARARRQMSDDGALAVTAPDGTFVASGLPSGSNQLLADHEDYARTETTLELDPAASVGPVEIALREGGAVEGVVIGDDGRPVVGARVLTMTGFAADTRRQTVTDELGHYRLEHLEPGMVRVIVMKIDVTEKQPDMASVMSGMKMETVKVEQGETTMLSFPTHSGGLQVSGRVLLPGGEPLEAVVMWFPDQGGRLGVGSLASTVSGDDGAYSVQLPGPGRYRVVARRTDADGERGRGSYVLEAVVKDQPDVQLDLRIADTRVSGQVTSVVSGEPLSGVQIFARPTDGALRFAGSVTTGEAGNYALDGLEPGSYDLLFRRRGYALDVLSDLEIDDEDVLEDRDVQLLEATPVRVEVTDPQGRALEGVWVQTLDRERIGGQQLGLTDPDGLLSIDLLPAGDHQVAMWAEGHALKIDTVTASVDVESAQRFELGQGIPLTVTTVGASDEPLKDVSIAVRGESGIDLTEMVRLALSAGGKSLVTGPEGRVELPMLEAGEYEITASLGELETSETVTLEQGESTAIEIALR